MLTLSDEASGDIQTLDDFGRTHADYLVSSTDIYFASVRASEEHLNPPGGGYLYPSFIGGYAMTIAEIAVPEDPDP